MGENVGDWDGGFGCDGRMEGDREGNKLAVYEGNNVGSLDGIWVAKFDGFSDDKTDGTEEGMLLG